MTEYLIQMAASLILSVIEATIKNTDARNKYRRVMTKIRDVLLIAYPLETFDAGTSRISDNEFVPGMMQTIPQMSVAETLEEDEVPEVAEPEHPKGSDVNTAGYSGVERRTTHQIMIPERRGTLPTQARTEPVREGSLYASRRPRSL